MERGSHWQARRLEPSKVGQETPLNHLLVVGELHHIAPFADRELERLRIFNPSLARSGHPQCDEGLL